jgi:hypothetical protein
MASCLRSGKFWGLALALLAGGVFRLTWPGDMEYKTDEAWVYELVHDFIQDGRFMWLGMPSSQNVRIPGLSIWQFYPLGALFGVDDPVHLVRGVQVLNCLALVALLLFAWRVVAPEEREWWLWTVALVCVNPSLVLFHRKIWPPSAMTIGLVALLLCWWRRERRWGAFGWGALAALLFQIHVGMLFHAAALTAYTWLADRRRVTWRWWLAGSVVAALPALPWLWYMRTTHDHGESQALQLHRLVEGKYWSHWASEPVGMGLNYALGPDSEALRAWPNAGGVATHGVALLQVVAAGLGVGLLLSALARWWRQRPPSRDWLGAGNCQSELILHAMFWGFGLVLSATCLRFYRHYLLLAFPFPMLWLARLALPRNAGPRQLLLGRGALLAICVTTALITASTLWWIHDHGGTMVGGYGLSYSSQADHGIVQYVPPLSAR